MKAAVARHLCETGRAGRAAGRAGIGVAMAAAAKVTAAATLNDVNGGTDARKATVPAGGGPLAASTTIVTGIGIGAASVAVTATTTIGSSVATTTIVASAVTAVLPASTTIVDTIEITGATERETVIASASASVTKSVLKKGNGRNSGGKKK